MSDELTAGSGDGAQLPVGLIAGENAQIESDAARLLDVLQAVAGSKLAMAPAAQKYADRLTFAMTRLEELKAAAAETMGGVFAQARAEVAASILQGHVAGAAHLPHRPVDEARRARPPRAAG